MEFEPVRQTQYPGVSLYAPTKEWNIPGNGFVGANKNSPQIRIALIKVCVKL